MRAACSFEGLLELGEGGEFGLDLVVCVGGLVELFDLGVALVDGVEIGEQELGVDDVDVVERVDAAGDVDDLGVGEAADDVADGIGGADVAEELVAEAFALAAPSTRPAMSMNSMVVGRETWA